MRNAAAATFSGVRGERRGADVRPRVFLFGFAGVIGLHCAGDLPAPIEDALIARLRANEIDGAIPGKTKAEHIFKLGERVRIMDVVWAVESAQREMMAPEKVNLASFGNMTPHVHWHVIPRYRDDAHFPNPTWAVALPSLRLSALRLAVAMAVSSGAEKPTVPKFENDSTSIIRLLSQGISGAMSAQTRVRIAAWVIFEPWTWPVRTRRATSLAPTWSVDCAKKMMPTSMIEKISRKNTGAMNANSTIAEPNMCDEFKN